MDRTAPARTWDALRERYGLDQLDPPEYAQALGRLEAFLAFCIIEDLAPPDVLAGFGAIAEEQGLSVARVMVAWRLLDTKLATEQIVWRRGVEVDVDHFAHGQAMRSGDYQRSPIRALVDDPDLSVIRRRICEPDERVGFPAFDDLAADGITDYAIWKVAFGHASIANAPGAGVLISFASDREGGFSDGEFMAVSRLRYMLAVALRNSMQTSMRESVTRTYLARSATDLVNSGDILTGSGSTVDSVIWYCDLRGSTALCERLGLDRYLPLLNAYFAATAGEVLAHGGDVLDFIGDAVLASWPHTDKGLADALDATRAAVLALDAFRVAHGEALGFRPDVASVAGIAIDTGPVMSGNIGITERLTFSVIGPTVNQVARIERVTKTLHVPVLVTGAVAAAEPGAWISRGLYPLDGVAVPLELFALAEPAHAMGQAACAPLG